MDKILSYEEAVKELEHIVKELEKGDLSLDKALDLFSQGINYVKACKNHLDTAEGKIKMLMDDQEIEFNQWPKED